MATTETYSKNYGVGGYTREEAEAKKFAVDEAHGIFDNPNSAWLPAEIVPDARGGWKVIHKTKR